MILSILDEKDFFQTCRSERKNTYDLVQKVAEAFGLDGSLANSVSVETLSWNAMRPADSSSDTSRISVFTKPLSIEEGLKYMIESQVVV